MKALSIRQPWAHYVAMGVKTIETRRRDTHFRGRFLIHASGRWDWNAQVAQDCIARGLPELALPCDDMMKFTGGIIGAATLVDVVHVESPAAAQVSRKEHLCIPTFRYAWPKCGFTIEDAILFSITIPCKGTIFPLFWTPPDYVIAQAEEEMAA